MIPSTFSGPSGHVTLWVKGLVDMEAIESTRVHNGQSIEKGFYIQGVFVCNLNFKDEQKTWNCKIGWRDIV